MPRNRALLLLLLFLILGIISSMLYALYRWDKPLGPALELPSYTPPASAVPSISSGNTPLSVQATNPGGQDLTSGSSLSSTQHATPTLQPLCSGPTTMTILAIGSDARSTGYLYGLADSIHIIRVDFTVPSIMVIDFPRDLWVEIPDISEHYGITHGKLNQAYLFGNPGMGYYDGPGAGPGLLARTLDLNFGLRVDHYLAINTQTFVRFIDAVGGVDVKVDAPIDLNYDSITPDPTHYLSVGEHHLDGELALILATDRIPNTFQRMIYEKMIMSSLREKLLNPAMLPRLPKLAAQFVTSIQTDLSPAEINSLICIAQVVPTDNIRADSLPEELFTAGVTYDEYRNVTTFIYNADFITLRTMVTEFMHGIWPIPDAEATSTPQP